MSRDSRFQGGDPLGRALYAAAVAGAVLGGLVLSLLAGLTVVSIVGRNVFGVAVPGDFELVEMGCAVAVFAFLPYGQMVRGNAVVDIFTAGAGPRTRAVLDGAGSLLYAAIAGLLTWRLALGGLELARYGETTMVLRVPLWWGFAPAVASLGFLTLVCVYTAWRDFARGRVGAETGL